jgi:S1-C subfamily serine protease
MKKIMISLVSAMLILGGCSFITKQILKNKRKSFVQVMALSIQSASGKPSSSVASGFAVAERDEGTYIMTAGHFCVNSVSQDGQIIIENNIFVNTSKGESHKAVLVGLSHKIDACLLRTAPLDMEPLEVSLHDPSRYDEVLNIAAPAGMFGEDVALVYEGRYIGKETIGSLSMDVYNIPAFPGSSGSPVLNSYGHVIGMVVSTAGGFFHMAFSPTHQEIIDFLEKHIDLERYEIPKETLLIE